MPSADISLALSAANNVLLVLGASFVLCWGLPFLKDRPNWLRMLVVGGGFGIAAVISMDAAFPVTPRIDVDVRLAPVALAGIVRGPGAALVAAAIAAAYRLQEGGNVVGALAGIAAAGLLGSAFWHFALRRSPLNLGLFGLALAILNVVAPLVPVVLGDRQIGTALSMSLSMGLIALVLYPAVMVLLGRLVASELERIDEETRLRSDNASLHRRADRFDRVFDLANIAMAWSNVADGRLVRVNAQYADLTGYAPGELISKHYTELTPGSDRDVDRQARARLISGKADSITQERRYLRKDGSIAWGLRTLTAVEDEGDLRYFFAIVQDITESKRDREEMVHLVEHDALTGLANRRSLLVLLDQMGKAASRAAVCYLDLDESKEIADTLGHPVADRVLVEVARRLKACIGRNDMLARVDGDAFAVVHANLVSRDEAYAFAERLQAALAGEVGLGDQTLRITASLGLVITPDHGTTATEILRRADLALAAAKAERRGSCRVFEPEMEAAFQERSELKAELEFALDRGQLDVEYQPIFGLSHGEITGFEALMRWRHPARGAVPPAVFIPLAEETGLIERLGAFVLKRAFAEAAKWPAHLTIAVNVSRRQLRDRTFPLKAAAALGRAGINPQRVEFEITESALIDGTLASLAVLEELRGLGVRIALDDFASGHASFGTLQRFQFDRIKIDRIAVEAMPDRERAARIVSGIVRLCKSLGVAITAKGIETVEQLEKVRVEGCDDVQGFLLGKPMPAMSVPAVVARQKTRRKAWAAAG